MLGVVSALVGYQIRTDVERELRRVGASARELGVHVELFTLTAGLHRAFTVGIIPVVGHEAVVIGSRQAVLLVPAELALGCGRIQHAILLDAACIDIDQVAVEVLDGSRSVLTEHQAADAVLRGVAPAVIILHVILRVVGLVDARQSVIIVVVSDGLAFLGKVGRLIGQHMPSASY